MRTILMVIIADGITRKIFGPLYLFNTNLVTHIRFYLMILVEYHLLICVYGLKIQAYFWTGIYFHPAQWFFTWNVFSGNRLLKIQLNQINFWISILCESTYCGYIINSITKINISLYFTQLFIGVNFVLVFCIFIDIIVILEKTDH